jgi:hypothetical protein
VADLDGAVEQVEPRLALLTDDALADGLPQGSPPPLSASGTPRS